MPKIKARLIGIGARASLTEKERKEFIKFCKCLAPFNDGIVITPYYSKDGELMSFIVDSKKAAGLIKNRGG